MQNIKCIGTKHAMIQIKIKIKIKILTQESVILFFDRHFKRLKKNNLKVKTHNH